MPLGKTHLASMCQLKPKTENVNLSLEKAVGTREVDEWCTRRTNLGKRSFEALSSWQMKQSIEDDITT